MSLTLVILAAGVGSRYGGLKQLAPVGPGAETLLEYAAFDALRAGFQRVVVVVRPETEPAVRERLDPGMARQVPLTYVHQCLDDLPAGVEPTAGRVKPWGTGQAVLAAESAIDGPFAVVNADDFYGAESYAAIAASLRPGDRRLATVGFRVADTLVPHRYADPPAPVSRALLEVDDSGRLRRIVELREVWRQEGRILYRDAGGRRQVLAGDELVSMNVWGFVPGVLDELRCRFADFLERSGRVAAAEFLLPDVIQSMIRDRRFEVEVLPAGGGWCGITHRRDQQHARSVISSLVQEGRYPQELWS